MSRPRGRLRAVLPVCAPSWVFLAEEVVAVPRGDGAIASCTGCCLLVEGAGW
ncbi:MULTISPECIES: hypothetical protein [unclassified Actinopolyspora]|uniref:hypothetical protein n=1 Tax=unclassified Actinopolyspora TaxID=2639451 RepID=UPI0013F660F9|nr:MULTISPECIES: hypothetical protein [unclassified Actinopolyspora]NHD19415.1 hypothetical protein [Actinopolyspora sp. BKK2]NHE78512.1 hypothetical protein [Actinopolyspora sp. BKK1]